MHLCSHHCDDPVVPTVLLESPSIAATFTTGVYDKSGEGAFTRDCYLRGASFQMNTAVVCPELKIVPSSSLGIASLPPVVLLWKVCCGKRRSKVCPGAAVGAIPFPYIVLNFFHEVAGVERRRVPALVGQWRLLQVDLFIFTAVAMSVPDELGLAFFQNGESGDEEDANLEEACK